MLTAEGRAIKEFNHLLYELIRDEYRNLEKI